MPIFFINFPSFSKKHLSYSKIYYKIGTYVCILSRNCGKAKQKMIGDEENMKILVINAGSSSLKYQLMDPGTGEVFAKGLCERIKLDGRLNHRVPARDIKEVRDIPMPLSLIHI